MSIIKIYKLWGKYVGVRLTDNGTKGADGRTYEEVRQKLLAS